MDVKRSWPWKKKSLDKILEPAYSTESSPVHSSRHPDVEDLSRILTDYGRLSVDATVPVQPPDGKLKHVEGRLSAALMDISLKDELVKQHTKVAEEAVSGWEKAEAETMALRQQLDAALQQKLAAEDRVLHLDAALKECTRQLRHAREEQEQKIHDALSKKTKDWNKIRCEFEEKLEVVEQQLVEAETKGNVMSKSLQDQARTISEITEAHSRAEADMEILKVGFDTVENQNVALKYEVHVLTKELEIRNEEREIGRRAADAASKQHSENVKRIAKLEAECQRLRSLVRQKLPGPAAVAQMKFEVETLGKEKPGNNRRRTSGKSGCTRKAPDAELLKSSTSDNGVNDNEALLERMYAMEEETKLLKEVLAKRNTELQSARLMCARTASKLSNVEEQLDALSHSPELTRTSSMLSLDKHIDASTSVSVIKEPSQASISQDGKECEQSNAESWASALIMELAHFKKGKVTQTPEMNLNASTVGLMDDFIQMEQLASISPSEPESAHHDSNRFNSTNDDGVEQASRRHKFREENTETLEQALVKRKAELDAANQRYKEVCRNLTDLEEQFATLQSKNAANELALINFREKMDMIFEAQDSGVNVEGVLEQVRVSLGISSHRSVTRLRAQMRQLSKGLYSGDTSSIRPLEGCEFASWSHPSTSVYSSSEEEEAPSSASDVEATTSAVRPALTSTICKVVRLVEELVAATVAHQFATFADIESQLGFVEHIAGSASNFPKSLQLDDDLRKFVTVSNQFLNGKIKIVRFMKELSSVLSQLARLNYLAADGSPQSRRKPIDSGNSCSGFKGHEEKSGVNSPVSESSKSNGSEKEAAKVAPTDEDSAASVEVLKVKDELRNVQAEKLSMECHMREELSKFVAMEEEIMQLKSDKIKLENDLATEREKLEHFKAQVHATEQFVADLSVQLASAEQYKNLADEHVANMAASKEELESQLMITKAELQQVNENLRSLEKEVLEGRKQSEELEVECQKLQLQLLHGNGKAADDEEARLNKEQELAAAAERLADCQHTILVLGEQLKSLASREESMVVSYQPQAANSALSTKRVLSEKEPIHFHSQEADSGIGTRVASHTAGALQGRESASGRKQIKQDPGWYSQDVDVSDYLDSELANISKHGGALRRPGADLFGDRTPAHEDYIAAVALLPSSPESDTVSPKFPAKRAPRKQRLLRSSTGTHDIASSGHSEKHGRTFSRFFLKKQHQPMKGRSN